MKELDTLTVSSVGQEQLAQVVAAVAKGSVVEIRPVKDGRHSLASLAHQRGVDVGAKAKTHHLLDELDKLSCHSRTLLTRPATGPSVAAHTIVRGDCILPDTSSHSHLPGRAGAGATDFVAVAAGKARRIRLPSFSVNFAMFFSINAMHMFRSMFAT